MKKIISVLLIICSLAAIFALPASAAGGLESLENIRSCHSGLFSDMPEGAAGENVALAYEKGFIDGNGDGTFGLNDRLSIADTARIAAKLHRGYETGSADFREGRVPYDVYVRYSMEKGLLDSRFGCRREISRAQFADMLFRTLPQEEYPEINYVVDDAIPDVSVGDEYAGSIYALYRAGIMTGSDEEGHFEPEAGITRLQAATMLARIFCSDRRSRITLAYAGPDVPERERKDDDFFADAAIIGNSLVDGLRIFSGLSTPDYYCATSVSVISAMNTKTETLDNGAAGTLVQKLCERQYGKVYIELGINEIGFDSGYFKKIYGEMVEAILSAEPETKVYIISVLPVTKSRAEAKGSYFTMERIREFNRVLRELAGEKKCWYLDVCGALTDETGYLPEEYASDGVHLQPEKYSLWEEYLRTHYK